MTAMARWLRLLLAVPLAVAVAGGSFTAARLMTPPGPLVAAVTASAAWVPAPGTPPPVPLPAHGSLRLDALGYGSSAQLAALDADMARPIASVAKTMTALVIAEAKPLADGQDGPVITIGAQDVADYVRIGSSGGSTAPVHLGERFTERQLLLGLMLPSANNLALTAARWVSGSVPQFVAALNTRAAALGMAHTHFADPAGLDTATTSTASDLVRLGEAAVANGAVLSVVSTATAALPDGSLTRNLNRLLTDEPGWIGIKTGWTPEASGCLLFAARRVPSPGAQPLIVVGAVLGQPPDATVDAGHPELGGAFKAARTAVSAAFAGYAAVRIGSGSIPSTGTITAPWGAGSTLVLRGADHVVLLRLGDRLSVSADVTEVVTPAPPGVRAASIRVSTAAGQLGSWTMVTSSALDSPASSWLLTHP
jgi:D-alanyl-D-alanine carboxypeptidase (penicillin-binding protein 5/6)